ncbi:glycosyltransferase family A protein [Caviibacterium pharyngocola]|uniref:Glycosyltransferase n=1 Tax=Caviibacterium pharyngocola TaxID=28159 RepID=A0A2M8RTW2_9PAST|nr:glycosyltransferase family A protein [Caviibacterium pharyngocola]PJG82331.1 glycosyltransferase [Caviibacterium pharyngocola]
MTSFPNIDVIIPCYNCAATLGRAVESVLQQPNLGRLYLVDDASTDNTRELAEQFVRRFPDKIRLEILPYNGGVAKARNWGALQSNAEFIAFLDADDAYEFGALEAAASIFYFRPQVSVVRLALKPVDLAERYRTHPNIDHAWQYMRMTCGGNVVFNRAFFFACGGFPQDPLFCELGGEDGALGIATTKLGAIATLFEDVGVLHYCREGMHAERLLDAVLFGKNDERVTAEKMAQANQVTDEICRRVNQLKCGLNTEQIGIQPLRLERAEG